MRTELLTFSTSTNCCLYMFMTVNTIEQESRAIIRHGSVKFGVSVSLFILSK